MRAFTIDLDSLLTVAAGVLDERGVLLQANAGFRRLLPAGLAQPIGAKVARFFIQPSFATLISTPVAAEGRDIFSGLMTIGDYTGRTRSLLGRVWRTASGMRVLAEYDIAELERLNDEMIELHKASLLGQSEVARLNVAFQQREEQIVETSLTDALTSVGNRRKLEQALATEISRVRRVGGTLSAIMADIDHFKRVNDRYGHAAGDKVLVRFGNLLKSRTRATDIVTRYGGEEFIVLLPHTSLEQATSKAEQLRVALAAERIEPLAEPVTSSFGVAELLPGEGADSLSARVDAALYQAKAGGRDRVVAAGSGPQGSLDRSTDPGFRLGYQG